MNDQVRPKRLFRYFPEAASDFFSAGKLWFSAPRDYNDPFDGLPRFDTMLESQIQRGIGLEYAFLPPHVDCDYQTFKRDMKRDSDHFRAEGIEATTEKYRQLVGDRIRLVCFSEKLDELLMWAHYGSSHRGFVVEFDPKHRLFATEEFGRVNYSNERPDVEAQTQTPSNLWKSLFTKSPDWNYEAEWRFVKSAGLLPTATRRDGKDMRYIEVPTDSILRLFMGWQIQLKTRQELLQSLRQEKWRRVEKFVMGLHEANYAVGCSPWSESEPQNGFRVELDRLV